MGEFSMKDALKQFLDKSRIKGDIQAMQISDVWEDIMGKTVARYTDKLQIIGDKLIVSTQVAPLKNELIYQKEKIKQRVNEALGQKAIPLPSPRDNPVFPTRLRSLFQSPAIQKYIPRRKRLPGVRQTSPSQR